MRIIAYKITNDKYGKVIVQESTSDHYTGDKLDELFAFLLEPQSSSYWQPPFDACLRVCWDLDSDVAPILRLLGKDKCLKLYQDRKLYYPPFSIFYMPSKVFSVAHIPTKQKVSLYHLAQYYPDADEPETVDGVQALGEYLKVQLKRMGMEPDKLTSPVAVYENAVMQYLDLPKWVDIPPGAAQLAWKCAGKLWVEALMLGHFGCVWDYDITSSFPRVAGDMVDIRQLDWMQSPEYQGEAIYGYCEGEVTINEDVMVSPIIYTDEQGNSCTPVGTWATTITKGELDFINRNSIGSFDIGNGWWAIPREGEVLQYPLRNAVDSLLRYKARGRFGLQSMLAKRMSVGLYGKTLEMRENGVGPYFNPCWGAEISTQVRLQVAGWLYRHNIGSGANEGYKHLVSVGVDGCLFDEEIKLDRKLDKGWKLVNISPALVISSGLVYTLGKKPQGLTLADVVAMVREHPGRGYYQKALRRRLTLAEAIEVGLDKLGQEVETYTGFNLLGMEHDRVFDKVPVTGRQLLSKQYKSKPRRI